MTNLLEISDELNQISVQFGALTIILSQFPPSSPELKTAQPFGHRNTESSGDREVRTGRTETRPRSGYSHRQIGKKTKRIGETEEKRRGSSSSSLIRGLLHDALQLRPPHADAGAAPPPPVAAARRGLLGQQLPQVVVLLRRVAGALLGVVVAARPLAVAAAALLGAALLLAPPVRRQGGRGDEEVDAAALELGVGRHDDELLGGAPGRAGGGPRRGERVVGVRGEHGGCGHRAAELVDVPAEVHDADDVEGAAGDHAGQAAPQAVAHVAVVVGGDWWWCSTAGRGHSWAS